MSTEWNPAADRTIDAHHHLWDLAVRDQPWTAELPALRRTFAMEDLLPELAAHSVDGTLLVETINVAPETPELLDVAARHPEVLGVVGWVDLTAPDVGDALAALRSGPGGERLVGIRHQVQGESDPEWLLRPDVVRGLRAVAEAGLVYELLVQHTQLPAAVEVVERVPGLRWVLDHAGKPPVASGELDPWREHLSRLAGNPEVACKLSGLVTEAAEHWSVADLLPYADHVLEVFGPGRVMAGSDWPVCLLRASYAEMDALTDRLLAGLADEERGAVRGGTVERWYGLAVR